MADRNMTSAQLTALADRQIRLVTMVYVQVDGVADLYLNDGARVISWSGNNYVPAGQLLGYGEILESGVPTVQPVSIYLSAADRALIPIILNNEVIDRLVIIYKAIFDSDWVLIGSPIPIYRGHVDRPVIEDDPDAGVCRISLELTNEWADWRRRRGRRNNATECKRFYPDDEGFAYAHEITKAFIWRAL